MCLPSEYPKHWDFSVTEANNAPNAQLVMFIVAFSSSSLWKQIAVKDLHHSQPGMLEGPEQGRVALALEFLV